MAIMNKDVNQFMHGVKSQTISPVFKLQKMKMSWPPQPLREDSQDG